LKHRPRALISLNITSMKNITGGMDRIEEFAKKVK
jgi:hypothetical protein